MDAGIGAALREVERAFAGYPRRAVLERCPHCGPPVRVTDADLFWLSIKLGNTVGDRDDVKALLPLLFERLVTTDELDADIILGKLPHHGWRAWPTAEQEAVDGLLDRIWSTLLTDFPSRAGAFTRVETFFRAIAAVQLPPDRFLAAWDVHDGRAADRHLAEFMNNVTRSDRLHPVIREWVFRDTVRDRLFRGFEREQEDAEWVDVLARAYDLTAG